MSYVDLHLHLLPGVDDGPASVQDSAAFARRLAAAGVREAVVTPHLGHPDFRLGADEIGPRTEALQHVLDGLEIPLRLHPGAEINADAVDHLPAGDLDLVAQGTQGARWVLLEAPFDGIGLPFLRSCDRLWALGFGVVVAHPERSAKVLSEGRERLRLLLSGGALLQVNGCSLMGRHGPEARAAAERLLLDGSAYVLASDGHGGGRSHTLRRAHDLAVAAGASPLRAAQLTRANPRFLLAHGLPDEVATRRVTAM